MKQNEGKKIALSFLLMPFAVVIHGYVLSLLWKWFIVSTFNLPSISIIQAAGIILVVDFIFMKIDWKEEGMKVPLDEFVTKFITHSLTTPLALLGIGYIFTLFL